MGTRTGIPVLPGLSPLQRGSLAVVLEARFLLRLHPAPPPAGGPLPALRAGSATAAPFWPVRPQTGTLRQYADPFRRSGFGGLRHRSDPHFDASPASWSSGSHGAGPGNGDRRRVNGG